MCSNFRKRTSVNFLTSQGAGLHTFSKMPGYRALSETKNDAKMYG